MQLVTVTHRFTGEAITFLETATETSGKHLLIEVYLPPFGQGPPLHIHDEFVETFTVLEGTLTVTVNDTLHELSANQSITAPLHTAHTFTNRHHLPVRFQVLLTPPSQFEQSIRIHYGLMTDGFTTNQGVPKNLFYLFYILQLQNTFIAGKSIRLQRILFRVSTAIGKQLGMYEPLKKYIQ